jgi:hypothetical protein
MPVRKILDKAATHFGIVVEKNLPMNLATFSESPVMK